MNNIPNLKSIGNVEDLEKLKIVILILLQRLEHVKYKTEIIKLCFVFDYLYCKKHSLDKGLTTVDYVKYNYGPYSDHFVTAFNELALEGKIVEIGLPFGLGYSSGSSILIDLDPDAKNILDSVIQKFGNLTLREIKNYIYELPEFNRASFGEVIVLK